MNSKDRKLERFNCEHCGTEFGFKGYSQTHRFCNIVCAKKFIQQQTLDRDRLLFEKGELKARPQIFKFLIERDGNKCSICDITEWNGKPIRFWVDHIDGDATNNAPTNFRLVCPNCDSQSDTFGAKNYGNGRKSKGLSQYG